MKKAFYLLTIICFSMSTSVWAQAPFITTWQTNQPGSSDSTSITIPGAPGSTYDYDVDWENDGIYDDLGVIGTITHDYGVAGVYQVAIRGTFPRIYFNNGGDKGKILSIDQWGDIVWLSMNSAFKGALNLTYAATDAPDLSQVKAMSSMFESANSFNADLSNWDVSNIIYMNEVFKDADIFNGNISSWDVGSVTDMYQMFQLSAFNGDISNWNVSNVTIMNSMFANTPFNGDISGWDVSSVTRMEAMFEEANAFNSDLSTWDVSNVTDMEDMFLDATAFDQNLGDWNLHPNVILVNMLNNSALSIENYDSTLIGWEKLGISGRTLGAQGLTYCQGTPARDSLLNTYGWTIEGDTQEMPCTLTSTEDNLRATAIKSYPNPTTGMIHLEGIHRSEVQVLDFSGRLMQRIDYRGQDIDLSDLPTGLYLLHIFDEKLSKTLRVQLVD